MNHIDDERCLAAENRHPPHPPEILSGFSPLCPPINGAVMVEISVTPLCWFDLKQSLFEWWDVVAVTSRHKSFTCWSIWAVIFQILDVWKAIVLKTSRYITSSCDMLSSVAPFLWMTWSIALRQFTKLRQKLHYLHPRSQHMLPSISSVH